MQGAGAQRAPRAAVEDRGAPEHRGNRKPQADPPEERPELVADAVEVAAVEREGDQHDVAGDRARRRDADQQRALLAPGHVARLDPAEGVGGVADGVEEPGDLGKRRRPRVPGHRGQSLAEVEPHLRHAAHDDGELLDQPHARRAVNALQVELDPLQPRRQGSAVELVEGRVVELRKALARHLRRLLGCVDPLLDVVVAVETVAPDHLVGHPAAVAAELPFGSVLDQTRWNRQTAVGAFDWHREDCRTGVISNFEFRISNFRPPAQFRSRSRTRSRLGRLA